MHLIRHIDDLAPDFQNASVAIGNFDGVHPGHQKVIGQAREEAICLGRPSGVVTFEPHARRFFRPDEAAFTLTRLEDKTSLISRLGVDLFYALDFDAAMASRSAANFIEEILVRRLNVSHVTVGHDFHFGQDRKGTPTLLAEAGRKLGFGTTIVPAVEGPSGTYASTRIRDALTAGNPELAALLLGRPWTIAGVVSHGDQRGRTINFPTANIVLGDYLEPALGVYAVRIERTNLAKPDPVLKGVANLGRRPTFGGTEVRLEVHIFDFAGDLYDQTLSVSLIKFLRPEQKFDGLEALKVQIARDARAARDALGA